MAVRCRNVLLIGLLCCFGLPQFAGALELRGDIMQGGLVVGRVAEGRRVFFNGEELARLDDGRFLFGFGRDAAQHQELLVVGSDGARHKRTLDVRKREYAVQRIDGISPRMMEPSTAELQRIRREARQVAGARERSSALTAAFTTFRWPLQGRITGVYGSRRILNGEPRRPHYGIDIAAPRGTPVRAPAGGIVRLAHPGMFFSGATLIIDHGFGLSSSFLHLEKILVAPGETVSAGQAIATVGASGRVTGAHLDWRVNWFEKRLDPALLVPPMPAP